jgi:hypothetical protein
MNAINAINSNYINQYQTSEINSTTQTNDTTDTDALAKKVYEQADVTDSVEISSEAQSASYAQTTKGLSDDQINSLKDQMKSVEIDMIRKMIESVNQSFKSTLGSIFSTDSDSSTITLSTGAVLSASDFALPSMPTTQAEAQAAIADGGEWSVDSTASRIVDLSVKIANGDLDMLETMKNSFLSGYKAAASAWGDSTGSNLPSICKDTYNEVLKRFDAIKEEWTQAQSTSDNDA